MKKGFTLTELLVVLGITAALLSLVTINLLKPQTSTSTTGAANSVVADLKQQQIKAMMGEGATGVASPAGIYFNSTSYTLFSGLAYSPNNSDNFTIDLPQNVKFSNNTFPGSKVVFAPLSGEVVGFVSNSASVTVGHVSSSKKETIQLNKYGVIIDEE